MELMAHQKAAVELARTRERHLYAYDTGTGKTGIALTVIREKKQKALVVCPLSIIENAWMGDLRKFTPELTALNLWAARKSTRFSWDHLKKYDIVIVNFESFKLVREQLERCGFGILIIDESSKIKQVKTQVTKQLSLFARKIPYCYLFSGTPAPNSELEWFSQVRIVDESIFGLSYYRFRSKYFYPCGYGGYQWKIQPGMKQRFLDEVARASTCVRKEDVLDLPERTDNIRTVYLDRAEIQAYREMKNALLTEIEGGIITAGNAAIKIMKLRQITAGFLLDEDGKDHPLGNSKLNALTDLLEEIGPKQVLIWTQFIHEAETLSKELGDRAGVINGTIKQEDRDETIRRFLAGDLQYIIAHPRSLGHGVTLVNCSYAVYYSLDYSHEGHYQSRDRIYRMGQKNKCSYYYLLAEKSIDEIIYKALQAKADVEAAVFEYIKNEGRRNNERRPENTHAGTNRPQAGKEEHRQGL